MVLGESDETDPSVVLGAGLGLPGGGAGTRASAACQVGLSDGRLMTNQRKIAHVMLKF